MNKKRSVILTILLVLLLVGIQYFRNPKGFVLKNDSSIKNLNNGRLLQDSSIYDQIYSPSDGMQLFKQNEKYGYLDAQGELSIVAKYDFADHFSEGRAKIGLEQNDILIWGFIDQQGNEIVPPQYIEAYSFSEGLAAVMKNENAAGYIDRNGRTVIPEKYQETYPFSEGLAAVKENGKWGVIDQEGIFVIEPQFMHIPPSDWQQPGKFEHGLLRVSDGEREFYIDRTGKETE